MGSARSGVLGEATINLGDYVSSKFPVSISLPLKKCNHGIILSVKIQCLNPRAGSRKFERRKEDESLLFASSDLPKLLYLALGSAAIILERFDRVLILLGLCLERLPLTLILIWILPTSMMNPTSRASTPLRSCNAGRTCLFKTSITSVAASKTQVPAAKSKKHIATHKINPAAVQSA